MEGRRVSAGSYLPVSSYQSTAFSEAVTWEAGPPGARKRKNRSEGLGWRQGGGSSGVPRTKGPSHLSGMAPEMLSDSPEAEDAKRVSQDPFLSEKGLHHIIWLDDSLAGFLKTAQRKKRGQEIRLWKQVVLWAQVIIEKPRIPDTS